MAHVLICTNEEHKIVSVDGFFAKYDAVKAMDEAFENEIKDATSCGFGEDLDVALNRDNAYVKYGEQEYHWEIWPVKL